MNSVFTNDPFATVDQAFRNIFPGIKYEAQFAPELKDDEGKEVWGMTLIPDESDGIPMVFISAKLKLMDAVEIFAHELAHVAVPGEEHSETWEKTFKRLHQEYGRIVDEKEAILCK